MIKQKCRRHPSAPAFLADCSGCKQELFDIEQTNRAETQRRTNARAALATIGTSPTVRILSVTQIDTALIVATEQPGNFRYAVDTFRLPTTAETDSDQVAPRDPGEWVLVEQHGDHTRDQVARMCADATAYLAEIGITVENTLAAA